MIVTFIKARSDLLQVAGYKLQVGCSLVLLLVLVLVLVLEHLAHHIEEEDEDEEELARTWNLQLATCNQCVEMWFMTFAGPGFDR